MIVVIILFYAGSFERVVSCGVRLNDLKYYLNVLSPIWFHIYWNYKGHGHIFEHINLSTISPYSYCTAC